MYVAKHFIENNKEMIPYWEKQFNIEDYLRAKMPNIEEEDEGQHLF